MLDIRNLSVSYGCISTLQGISIKVNEGEIVALIGGNGAGKSTTLMAVSGLVEKESGEASQIGKRRVGKECRSRWSPYH